ncbi:MAG TPA: hypothetical protein VFU47_07240 [Armatimonadota bacterium]|nr:hypothetical protein [Armatimonadota bacterium]
MEQTLTIRQQAEPEQLPDTALLMEIGRAEHTAYRLHRLADEQDKYLTRLLNEASRRDPSLRL